MTFIIRDICAETSRMTKCEWRPIDGGFRVLHTLCNHIQTLKFIPAYSEQIAVAILLPMAIEFHWKLWASAIPYRSRASVIMIVISQKCRVSQGTASVHSFACAFGCGTCADAADTHSTQRRCTARRLRSEFSFRPKRCWWDKTTTCISNTAPKPDPDMTLPPMLTRPIRCGRISSQRGFPPTSTALIFHRPSEQQSYEWLEPKPERIGNCIRCECSEFFANSESSIPHGTRMRLFRTRNVITTSVLIRSVWLIY